MLKPTVELIHEAPSEHHPDGGIFCRVTWTGADLDRPSTGGTVLGPRAQRLAERYKRAVEAGAVFYDVRVVRDIAGETYVQANDHVLARHMNADLKRLGY